MGLIIILSSSLNHPLLDIQIYSIEVILKIILSLIILPIFRKVIPLIFRMQDDISPSSKPLQKQVSEGPATGYGIYEGIVFLTSALFTTVITEHITFNSF
jgi:hypothetical protein